MKSVLLSLFCSVFLFLSCSKSKDTAEVKAESQLIGKWYLKKWVANDVSGTGSRPSSGNYNASDYLQFESGGKLTARVDAQLSLATWQLLDNNKKLWIISTVLDTPDDGYQIKTLNSSSLVLYVKEGTGTSYSEMTIYLEK
ncbi:MAG: hypothetical protein INR73_06235 [Williamsia sp.]|nr:hypothetical protein [Williamsia sp.]